MELEDMETYQGTGICKKDGAHGGFRRLMVLSVVVLWMKMEELEFYNYLAKRGNLLGRKF
ncbi:hypothetical protein MKW98_003799, partial [Papaver atlanticum]